MRFLLQAVQGWSIKHGVKSYGELLFLKMQHQLWCARFLILGRTSCWCKQILIWIQHKYILNRSKKFWKRLCLTRRLCLGSRYVGTITMLTELCVDFFFFFFAELCVDFRIMCPYLTQLCLHCLIIFWICFWSNARFGGDFFPIIWIIPWSLILLTSEIFGISSSKYGS